SPLFSTPYLFSLAGLLGGDGVGVEDAEHFVFAHDEIFVVIQFDIAAGVLAEQDAVAGLDVQRYGGAVLEALAFSDGDDFALLGLFLGGVGDVQAALHLLFLLDPFDHDAVIERTNVHGSTTSNM